MRTATQWRHHGNVIAIETFRLCQREFEFGGILEPLLRPRRWHYGSLRTCFTSSSMELKSLSSSPVSSTLSFGVMVKPFQRL